jgi:hypothetical protein
MIEAQTPTTSELAKVLPVPTAPQAIRERGWRRLVKKPRRERAVVRLPPDVAGLLWGERVYPSAELVTWLHRHGGQYRRRWKGNLTVDTGGCEATTGAVAEGGSDRYLAEVRLFHRGGPTTLGIVPDAGHEEPGLIARDCRPPPAAVRADGTRGGIEPPFSDFKRRGFHLEDTQLHAPDRVERLLLIRTRARYGCGSVGRHEALYNPTPLDKKAQAQTAPHPGSVNKVWRSLLSWFKRGLRLLQRRLQTDQPLPAFIGEVMRN